MKNIYRDRGLLFSVSLLILGFFALLGYLYTRDSTLFWFVAPVGAFVGIFATGKLIQVSKSSFQYYKYIDEGIDAAHRVSLYKFPIAVAIVDPARRIVWSNSNFFKEFFEVDAYTNTLDLITKLPISALSTKEGEEITYSGRYYRVIARKPVSSEEELSLIYFEDVTEFKNLMSEYILSKPVVILIQIDNLNEFFSDSRDSEKAHISVQIDKLVEDFASETTGVLRKLKSDQFLLMIEERDATAMVEKRMNLLDKAREIIIKDRMPVTLSIGIGKTAETMVESERFARQALDMALGRGGDQAAVKTATGFEFYGGVYKGVQRHTKVKTRIIANSLTELIENSDTTYIMGHKFGDLDSVGAAIGMAAATEKMGKTSFVVVDKSSNLATALIDKFTTDEYKNKFIHPNELKGKIHKNDLLIIVDTHNPEILEDAALYHAFEKVVVIDHHRKMVQHIDNAIIFFHEPFASSASEMVTELIQYFGDAGKLSPLEAEGLLAGITLDTKNFVMKTGVRTFEAAAFLKRLGADTVAVRELFSNSIENYQSKTALVSSAEIYKTSAIAISRSHTADLRIIAPQAADELLGISGVEASFVIYKTKSADVCISARSLGKLNVQVIMEGLGGGGHQTMAGVQLEKIKLEEARNMLVEEIDNHYNTLNLQ